MRAHAWRASSAYHRTALVGLTSAALLLWGLGSASGQAAAPEAPGAPFSKGRAKATAIVSRVAPGVGSLELGVANGIAVAELKNNLGQAQAQTLDLGLIGTTLTAESCRDPALTPDQLPQPTRVDNRKGDAAATTDEVPIADAALGAGRESARATTQPLASAAATSAASFGPVVTVRGGRAEATTEVVDGVARQAHATVDASLDIAGVVDLSGLRWEALHRTGGDPRTEATFDIGTASLLGVPIPLEDLEVLETTLNKGLAPSGITLRFPRVERFTEPSDLVRITPLRIVLKDSPAGKAVLGPALEASRAQREQLFDELTAQICDAAGALLVGDIAVSVVGGTGFLAIEIGGAEATSGDLVLENPFGDAIAPPSAGGAPAPPGVAPAVPGHVTPAGTTASPAVETSTPAASIGPLEELCETIHPFRSPSCSEGAMVPLGLLGLVATVGVAGLDWRHQRRRTSLTTVAGA